MSKRTPSFSFICDAALLAITKVSIFKPIKVLKKDAKENPKLADFYKTWKCKSTSG